jgi:N4-gp56 family major capsid protein
MDATRARNPEGNQLGKGDTYHWNIYSDIATQGGTLVETTTMPETNFTITQGTLTVNEYGNSVPYSGKLDDLSEHPIRNIIRKVLRNDAVKAFDIDSHAQFNATLLRVVPSSSGTATDAVTLTTDGTATLTNNLALGKDHVKAIVDLMKERNIPAYIADDYISIGWPTTFRTLKNDLESIHQYTEQGFALIHNGEIGRYENSRFVEQTHIPKGGAADSSTWDPSTNTADAWDQGFSDWAFFFGEDTVAEGIIIPEEMRGKLPSDFGRSKGIAWYAIEGFGQTQTSVSQHRIVKWDSAV